MVFAYARVKLANPRLPDLAPIAIPMEDMDLVVHPATRQVIPNPANPNTAGTIVMGVRHGRGQDGARQR